jgi:deoxyribodipyrimidine photolyase
VWLALRIACFCRRSGTAMAALAHRSDVWRLARREASRTFWRRLVWRDLAYWQLHHWPQLPTRNVRSQYESLQWAHNPEHLAAWQQGRTGFPLVDAGMRELWATGYMHQSVRIVVALFLTEYLNHSWVHGARWFHDTLADGDLAINCMMWQNAGKVGLDPWNFTSTPLNKSADPSGDYVRRCALLFVLNALAPRGAGAPRLLDTWRARGCACLPVCVVSVAGEPLGRSCDRYIAL